MTDVFSVWFLIGAALVFFMQCGFAMVETGFTRAKNAGNIIMKNLMDFCIGSVVFILLGYSLLCGEDILHGFVGKVNLQILTDYQTFDWSSFVFNLVFCATTATIVSGAMAERTKFLAYCVYSALISALIYPVEAHWIWGGGWLSTLGFHDFAGSCAIHMVGGVSALVGAAILGPRIGKFKRGEDGKVCKVHAIPGHSLTLGALGCFILWFGWYGFNGAAATTVAQLGSIFTTTTIAPAIATCTCMVFTWLKYGKPDVSMCLNASLAGLVGITAGCDVMDAAGAAAVGVVSGLLVVFGVWLLDYKLHVDDPVGAVAVHAFNGLWGTIAVGLFATGTAPECTLTGLFYGGGWSLFGVQCLGALCVAAWTVVTISLVFVGIQKTIGLRASTEEEIIGLDITEHNLASSYADFAPSATMVHAMDKQARRAGIEHSELEKALGADFEALNAHPVQQDPATAVMSKVCIVCRPERLEAVQTALASIGVPGITVTQALGYGVQTGRKLYYRGTVFEESSLKPRVKIEAVVSKVPVDHVVAAARKALASGTNGDGKIFIYNVENVIRVRTGEQGYAALQDETLQDVK